MGNRPNPDNEELGSAGSAAVGRQISILELAKLVKKATKSASDIRRVPYDEAYEEGFEDMPRRVPDVAKARKLVGFKTTMTLRDIIADIIEHHRRNDGI